MKVDGLYVGQLRNSVICSKEVRYLCAVNYLVGMQCENFITQYRSELKKTNKKPFERYFQNAMWEKVCVEEGCWWGEGGCRETTDRVLGSYSPPSSDTPQSWFCLDLDGDFLQGISKIQTCLNMLQCVFYLLLSTTIFLSESTKWICDADAAVHLFTLAVTRIWSSRFLSWSRWLWNYNNLNKYNRWRWQANWIHPVCSLIPLVHKSQQQEIRICVHSANLIACYFWCSRLLMKVKPTCIFNQPSKLLLFSPKDRWWKVWFCDATKAEGGEKKPHLLQKGRK